MSTGTVLNGAVQVVMTPGDRVWIFLLEGRQGRPLSIVEGKVDEYKSYKPYSGDSDQKVVGHVKVTVDDAARADAEFSEPGLPQINGKPLTENYPIHTFIAVPKGAAVDQVVSQLRQERVRFSDLTKERYGAAKMLADAMAIAGVGSKEIKQAITDAGAGVLKSLIGTSDATSAVTAGVSSGFQSLFSGYRQALSEAVTDGVRKGLTWYEVAPKIVEAIKGAATTVLREQRRSPSRDHATVDGSWGKVGVTMAPHCGEECRFPYCRRVCETTRPGKHDHYCNTHNAHVEARFRETELLYLMFVQLRDPIGYQPPALQRYPRAS
jgi:hypothetical protein